MSNAYTYEELVEAAAGSGSIGEVVRKLGREATASRKQYVKGLLRDYEIDYGHLRNASELYPRELLAQAAAASTSIAEVVRRIGANEVGGTQAHVGRQLRRYEIDISHFESLNPDLRVQAFTRESVVAAAEGATSIVDIVQRLGGGRSLAQFHLVRRELLAAGIDVKRRFERSWRGLQRVPDEVLAAAVAQARSIAECSRILGMSDSGQFRRQFHAKVAALGLDMSHMAGQAHARGQRAVARLDPAEILVRDPDRRRRVKTRQLRTAMIEIGMPYACARCGTGPDWLGDTITLEVDHIDGDISDNRPENLRFMCPNCHATTATYCRKKERVR